MFGKASKAVASFAAALMIWSGGAGEALAYGKTHEVYVVPNAHIDTAWKWTIPTTIVGDGNPETYLYNTWNKHRNLINSNPDYKFNASSAQHHAWIQEYYPELFNDIKIKEAQGKWELAGAAWVQHETMIASGESIARSYLLGQKYFKEQFGKYVDHAFLPDTFGISWIVPQILKDSGVESLMVTRISAVNDDLFRWKGVDGTELMTYRPKWMYPNGGDFWQGGVDARNGLRYRFDTVLDYPNSLGLNKGMYLLGAGDAGGGANQNQIDAIADINADSTAPVVSYRSVSEYNDAFTQTQKDLSPLREQELLLKSTHGTFTSQAAVKKYNRQAEIALEEAEKLNSVAMWLGAADYPSLKLDMAWKKKLVNDFHDILPGTTTREPTEEAWNNYEIALNLMRSSVDNALEGIAGRADTTGDGVPVVIYNALSFSRSDVVETTVTFNSSSDYVKVYNESGAEIPSQAVKQGNSFKVVFIAQNVPSLGHLVYRVVPSSTAGSYSTGLSSGGYAMNSNKYTIEINPANGNINRIYDKVNGKEVLYPNSEVELQRFQDSDQPWDIDYSVVSSAPTVINSTPKSIELIETGPVRNVYRVTKYDGKSTYTQDIVLYSGLDRIDLPTTVDWHEGAKLLKVAFKLSDYAKSPLTTYDLSYGAVARGINSIGEGAYWDLDDHYPMDPFIAPRKYEVPGHKWADVSSATNNFGVSILNDSKYGWDKPDENTIRLSLLRSARDLDSVQDEGRHTFTYSVYSHSGDWRSANTPQQAHSLNAPLLALPTTAHSGSLGKSFSFASVDKPNVLITAIKKKEDSNDFIVRLSETQGVDTAGVNVAFNGSHAISSYAETDLLEDDRPSLEQDVSISGNVLSTNLHKYEVKTFRVSLSSQHYSNTNPVVTRIALGGQYNLDGMSHDSNRNDGNVDGAGGSYSADLMPSTITSESISFDMGPSTPGQNNMIQALGQNVNFNVCGTCTGYNYLYVLAAAAGGGVPYGTFTVNYKTGSPASKDLYVTDWTQRIGAFNRDVATDTIAHVFTHNHQQNSGSGHDNVAKDNFMFMYRIPLDSARVPDSLTLPNNGVIKVMALSLASGGGAGIAPDTQAPTQVTGLTATAEHAYSGKVTLSWNAASDNVGIQRYSIYRDTSVGFAPSFMNKIGETPATTFEDKVAGHATYYYKVAAEDADNSGPVSSPAQALAGESLNLPYNADGFSYDHARSDGNFDGSGAAFLADGLDPWEAVVTYGDTSYKLGPLNGNLNNLVNTNSGSPTYIGLGVPGPLTSIQLLGAASYGNKSASVTIHYSDSSTSAHAVTFRDWCSNPSGETVVMERKFRHQGGIDQEILTGCYLYQYSLTPDAGKTVTGITLPAVANIHIAAIAVKPDGPATEPPELEDVQMNLGADSNFNEDAFSFDSNREDGDYDEDPTPTTFPADGLGAALRYNGTTYSLGPLDDGQLNSVKALGQTLALPSGEQSVYSAIKLLGSATFGDQTNQVFKVHYSDSSTSQNELTIKDWCSAAGTAAAVVSAPNRHSGNTEQIMSTGCHLYEYTLTTAPGKTVQSIELPNNPRVHVQAITLKRQVQVDLAPYFNEDAFSFDANRGDGDYDEDADKSTYPADELSGSSPVYSGTAYSYGPLEDARNNSVYADGQTIQVGAPNVYSALKLLGSATFGNQTNVPITIHYADASSSSHTIPEVRDWCAAPGSAAVVESFDHRHNNGADQPMSSTGCHIYEFALTPSSGKAVVSVTLPTNPRVHVLAMTLVP
ncbi:hypothetical protein B1A99_28685 [Cohnella sp. CIP 111063]|uniref:glycoside hydrolase family 38 N-terminal domain-containing protein n=1 Tax=unclassified Cohnella TaxID=2636738 RepID=UPI000B8BCEB7|nr:MULTISPECIES: glycoside hydrolase family 38 C-terminal domain-containing protein [unclassified Cohnella]OXS53876.1 hypothetical protein B1A99_28685 [Cohnella sp. CIP 111063]PRX62461.1 alpha-mannosidase [Cohnella sp. SGD-V74]